MKSQDKITDPVEYEPLIREQKRKVRNSPDDPKEWYKLGLLLEEKIKLTNSLAKRLFIIRYFPILFLVSSVGLAICPIILFYIIQSSPLAIPVIVLFSLLEIILVSYVYKLRYPSSGSKYFWKAVKLDPNYGEPYMKLGLIALRRFQKHKGYQLIEKAFQLGVKNAKVEKELKSMYEQEFLCLFNGHKENEVRLNDLVEKREREIKTLQLEVSSNHHTIHALKDQLEQIKWSASNKSKLHDKEMAFRINELHKHYSNIIEKMKKTEAAHDEEKELAERDFVRLTTEVMEAKAKLEMGTLGQAAKIVENCLGHRNWSMLSEQAKTCLATAEQIKLILDQKEDNEDYSLVGMELCKALEIEVNLKLVQPFIGYLNGNAAEFLKVNTIADKSNKPVYFSYLAQVVDNINFPSFSTLTLGQFLFVLEKCLTDEYALADYSRFLHKIQSDYEVDLGINFIKSFEIVTRNYRNAIAHYSTLKRGQYKNLRRLVFSAEDSLLSICSQIPIIAED